MPQSKLRVPDTCPWRSKGQRAQRTGREGSDLSLCLPSLPAGELLQQQQFAQGAVSDPGPVPRRPAGALLGALWLRSPRMPERARGFHRGSHQPQCCAAIAVLGMLGDKSPLRAGALLPSPWPGAVVDRRKATAGPRRFGRSLSKKWTFSPRMKHSSVATASAG